MTFTSELTVDELVLVDQAGYEPCELVLGSSYYHLGYATGVRWTADEEVDVLTDLLVTARNAAIDDIVNQARLAHADGIVGMRLEMEREGHQAEFTAMGTAVRRKGSRGAADASGSIFTCNLSAADFWALLRGGYRPVRLVHGVCVYHVAHQTLGEWIRQGILGIGKTRQNVEHDGFTQALYDAREIALGRVHDTAVSVGGDAGVMALEVREDSYGWDSHIIEFLAVGTAVARLDAPLIAPDDRPIGTVMVAQDLAPPPRR